MAADSEYLDHDGPVAVAHRGGASAWPENSMPAFQGAIDLGFRYLETDVQATVDGVLVAFHDETLDRATDATGRISEMTWDEVRAARIDGTEPIPRLEELLSAWPRARWSIDPKHDAAVDLLATTLQRQHAVGRVCVGAFSDARVARIRSLCGPELCTALGPRGVGRLVAGAKGMRVARPAGHVAAVPTSMSGVPVIDERLLEHTRRLGVAVHVWTIDDESEMVELLDAGVDGIMTDQPATLRSVLEARGEWHPVHRAPDRPAG